ncbi:copper amine oxidase domain-containing protein [Clostridioides difficile]|nr:copper amine oxidase domain-containing protein [Clostridioides difficile]
MKFFKVDTKAKVLRYVFVLTLTIMAVLAIKHDYKYNNLKNASINLNNKEVVSVMSNQSLPKGNTNSKQTLSVSTIGSKTIVKNDEYLESTINMPVITNSNKIVERSTNDKIKNDIFEFYNKSYKEAKQYLKDNPDEKNKFVANVDFELKKNTDSALSIKVRYYTYSGGAHGFYQDIAYNVDMRTGKFLELMDLFKDNTKYKEVIDEEIKRQIAELEKKDEENIGIYNFKGIKENQNFYLQDDNLVIYFDLYDITPYAAGIPEFSINKKLISSMLKPEYVDLFDLK